MTIYIDVDDNDVIQDIKFETFGCGAAIATSSHDYRNGCRHAYRGCFKDIQK